MSNTPPSDKGSEQNMSAVSRVHSFLALGILSSLVLLLLLTQGSSAAIIHVDDDASSGGDGSETSPFVMLGDALNASVEGDRILLAPGDYQGVLNVTQSITLEAETPGEARIHGGEEDIVLTLEADSVELKGLVFIGHFSGGALSLKGNGTRVLDCTVRDSGIGVFFNGSNGATVENLVIDNSSYGFYLNGSSDNLITGAWSQEGYQGVWITVNSSGNRIQDCNLSAQGAGIYSKGDNNSFQNNTLSGGSYGILLELSSGNLVENNICNYNAYAGIRLIRVTNSVVEGNEVFSPGEIGISLWNSSNCRVEDNYVKGGLTGLAMELVDDVVIEGNLVENQTYYSVYLLSANNFSLENNQVLEGAYIGVNLISCSNGTLENNSDPGAGSSSFGLNNCRELVFDNNSFGRILMGSSSYISLHNNSFPAGGGLQVTGLLEEWYTLELGEGNTVDGKPIILVMDQQGGALPTGAGQLILLNCSGLLIEDMEFSDAYIGLQLAYCQDNQLVNNSFSNCSDSGLYLQQSHNNSIRSNHFTAGMGGLYLSNCGNTSLEDNDFFAMEGGAYLLSSPNTTLTGNQFTDCKLAVEVKYSSRDIILLHNRFNNITLLSLDASYNYFAIVARENWWGHEAGPFNVEFNPNGQSAMVTGNVNFTAWLRKDLSEPQFLGVYSVVKEEENFTIPLTVRNMEFKAVVLDVDPVVQMELVGEELVGFAEKGGNYNVTISAGEGAAKDSYTFVLTVLGKNDLPVVTMDPITPGKHKGVVNITGTVYDEEGQVFSVLISMDGSFYNRRVTLVNDTSWYYLLDTEDYDNGNHSIRVQARDNSYGYSEKVGQELNIENEEDKEFLDGNAAGFMILILLVLAVTTGFAFVYAQTLQNKKLSGRGEEGLEGASGQSLKSYPMERSALAAWKKQPDTPAKKEEEVGEITEPGAEKSQEPRAKESPVKEEPSTDKAVPEKSGSGPVVPKEEEKKDENPPLSWDKDPFVEEKITVKEK